MNLGDVRQLHNKHHHHHHHHHNKTAQNLTVNISSSAIKQYRMVSMPMPKISEKTEKGRNIVLKYIDIHTINCHNTTIKYQNAPLKQNKFIAHLNATNTTTTHNNPHNNTQTSNKTNPPK